MQFKTVILLTLASSTLCAKKSKKPKEGMAFNHNIAELCEQNTNFRKEIITGEHTQIVLMCVKPGDDIGIEMHNGADKILVFVTGRGQAIINNMTSETYPDHLCFVPAGTKHNIKNTGSDDMKLYTIYAPPQHKKGTIIKSKDGK